MLGSAAQCIADSAVQTVQCTVVQCSAVTAEVFTINLCGHYMETNKKNYKRFIVILYPLNDFRLIQLTRSNDHPEWGRTEPLKII